MSKFYKPIHSIGVANIIVSHPLPNVDGVMPANKEVELNEDQVQLIGRDSLIECEAPKEEITMSEEITTPETPVTEPTPVEPTPVEPTPEATPVTEPQPEPIPVVEPQPENTPVETTPETPVA